MLQVVWQLDSSHRTFLPRLGGPLTCITRSAVDAGCYVISQADNTVRMVSHNRPLPWSTQCICFPALHAVRRIQLPAPDTDGWVHSLLQFRAL